MVPMTAFAAAKVDITAVDTISAAVDGEFNSRVELSKDEDGANLTPIEKTYNGAKYKVFEVRVTLENATFTKDTDLNGDEYYVMTDVYGGDGYIDKSRCSGVWEIDVRDEGKSRGARRAPPAPRSFGRFPRPWGAAAPGRPGCPARRTGPPPGGRPPAGPHSAPGGAPGSWECRR